MDRVQAATRCQQCNSKLHISGLEDLGKESSVAYRHAGLRSVMASTMGGSTRLDESFVVLDPTKHAKLNLQGEYIQQQSSIVSSKN